ncbi:MAG TPA: hypothetical protein VFP91_18610 [Vicinamibacterales bacterium]|nr:hypothetical protein [Vicinamibacterales bacterium]
MGLKSRLAVAAAIAALMVSARVPASAQTPQLFQFFVSATDASGAPLTDLRPEDVIMSEDGVSQPVVKVEPLPVPMKLTIVVDNGFDSADAIEHFRNGLTGLVEALPPDVEITLISTSPQPRTVVKPTSDHAQVLRGLKNFAPERTAPRFSDALVEYSQRLQKESKDSKAAAYLPVLLMLSTAANDQTAYQPKDIEKAVSGLVVRHARMNTVMVSTRQGDVASATHLKSSLQGVVSIPATRATSGRYEEVLVPSTLPMLLTQWGHDLATLHIRQSNQFRVTVERGSSGDLKNPRIELARPGAKGSVTRDGFLP